MESLKELLAPKSFNRLSFVAVCLWIVCGLILLGSFAEMENTESDFQCTVKLEEESLVQGKCSEQYENRFNKLAIPVYGFVIINFALILTVCAIYSQFVKPTVNGLLETNSNRDVERQHAPSPQTQSRRLFVAYCCQLAVRFALGILFIVLQTQLMSYFPSNYDCDLTPESNHAVNGSSRNIQNRTIYECRNEAAAKKSFWTKTLTVVNAVFAMIILTEIIWILSRVKTVGKKYLEDSQFLASHIIATDQFPPHDPHPYVVPSVFIEKLKKDIIKETVKPKDLAAVTLAKPGEGERGKDLNLEQIYVKLVAQKNRRNYDFPTERDEQVKVYPKPSKNAELFEGPEDFIDAENTKILVVGRPGIGKTLFCTKFLLDWAKGEVFNDTYDMAFLVKFRIFNSVKENLCLRELLTQSLLSENYLQSGIQLPDEVWTHIHENPDKVLILWDGFDEFNDNSSVRKTNVCSNSEKPMSLAALYSNTVKGNLLPGATVVTTTRPDSVSSISSIEFDKTVELLGFTSEKVEEYVKKFTENENLKADAGERILSHIKNNMILFSLCYIPVNCFIICSCLVYFLKSPGIDLPTKVTEIYNFAMKLFFFRHNEQYKEHPPSVEDIMSGNLPREAEEKFKQLGEIAFNGLEKGTLIFGKSEVYGLEHSALFHQMPDRKIGPFKREAQFCFLHLTMQEFLSAKHLVDTMNDAELRGFVSEHIKKGKWHVVLQFVAGLLGERKRPIDAFTDMLPVETEEYVLKRNELTSWPTESDRQTALTIMKCLYEHEDTEQASHNSGVQKKFEEIGFNAVDFSECSLAPSDCTAVIHLLKNIPQITCIILYRNHIGPLGCVEIRKLFDNGTSCQLTMLFLCDNNITDDDVLQFTQVIPNSKLTWLDLMDNNITDKSVLYLSKMIHNSKLTGLNLSGNNLTDNAVLFLSVVIPISKLTELHLRRNEITDNGVLELSKVIPNSKLTELDLSNNLISYGGVVSLCDGVLSKSNCKLTWLGLNHIWLTAETEQHIRNAYPNCKVAVKVVDKTSDKF